MKKLILIMATLIALITFICTGDKHVVPTKKETVVLLHGLMRSSKAMEKLEEQLRIEGYDVINHDYPSTTSTIEKLTDDIFKILEPKIAEAETVHFVTHSMGGIILRDYLEDHELPNLGRVVMMAPPSSGSEVTDKLGNIFLYKWINGPAGDQLGTGTNSHPLRLKVPEFELGIIAGDRSINPILSMLIPGADDGKVAVARVRPEQYTDFIQLHTTHATMMWNRPVIEQTIFFLNEGCFKRVPTENTRCSMALAAMYTHQGNHPLSIGAKQ